MRGEKRAVNRRDYTVSTAIGALTDSTVALGGLGAVATVVTVIA